MKTLLMGMTSLLLIGFGIGNTEPSKTMPIVEHKLLAGEKTFDCNRVIPYTPHLITDSPGDTVGISYYDYQSNGSTGSRIAVCSDGSIYCCWTNLNSVPYPPNRRGAYYNWRSPEGQWLAPGEGAPVNETVGGGYPRLDITTDDRGVITYHRMPDLFVSIEQLPGTGVFDHYHVPNLLNPGGPGNPIYGMWPNITVDRHDRIHIGMTGGEFYVLMAAYTRSDDGGATWTEPQIVDTVMVLGGVLDASPVSDRVVYAYSKAADTTTQWLNNIAYYVSEDGVTWDWQNGCHNITDYENDGDSLWAYTDLDVIFDYNDYIHLIWNAQWVTEDEVYFRTYLFHYSEETGEIEVITVWPEDYWYDIGGVWNRPICKMNLGVQEDGNVLFATWTQFDTLDVSACGYGNGEIYMSYSEYGGNWNAPVNLTNSPTPGCLPGQCDSDNWSTLADKVTENTIRLFYVDDKDAGGMPQSEGTATENPMRYLEYNMLTDIDEPSGVVPEDIALEQNYPNPFNQSTSISFSLAQAGPTRLEIFDVTGALVQTLIDDYLISGKYQITWDAGALASGIYLYKLTHAGSTSAGKAVLIK